MATAKLPDALSRRHLLEGQLDPAKAQAIGQAYLDADREVEALDFLARGGATDVLEVLQAAAIDRGDLFLTRSVARALGLDPGAETWQKVAEAAERGGRLRDAETARRLATVGA